ncbi:MAG TPA: D-tyrosyl-tRNA(Tyr) deacylase [Firmicutes bacterium]|jgi:D-aminoacyl-tRNA deacylase|nr:D-tyrosyl-tRNA(Tyr) deacylase [Bacillota bacterium]
MRAVVQRVLWAKVSVNDQILGEIGPGLLVLLGVGDGDEPGDVTYLAQKIVNLRIFEDESGKLNDSVLERRLALLIISQFTLYGDCRNGRRPSFSTAALPELGEQLYKSLCNQVASYGLTVAQGRFGSHMAVELLNDGPVTILLDSKRLF